MRRPIGVTILAVLAIIFGAVQLLAGLGLVGVSLFGLPAGFTVPGMELSGILGSMGVAAGVVVLLMAALYITFGAGALMLKSWAWTLGVVLLGISLIVNVVALFAEFTVATLVSAIIAAALLAYMFTHEVRTAFGHEHGFRSTESHNRPLTHV